MTLLAAIAIKNLSSIIRLASPTLKLTNRLSYISFVHCSLLIVMLTEAFMFFHELAFPLIGQGPPVVVYSISTVFQ